MYLKMSYQSFKSLAKNNRKNEIWRIHKIFYLKPNLQAKPFSICEVCFKIPSKQHSRREKNHPTDHHKTAWEKNDFQNFFIDFKNLYFAPWNFTRISSVVSSPHPLSLILNGLILHVEACGYKGSEGVWTCAKIPETRINAWNGRRCSHARRRNCPAF